jgi:predicted AAA+ superfamily ATPase
LLAGRAWLNHLHPLTHLELGNAFDLDHVLRWGTLPRVAALSDEVERKEFLKVYAQTYVRQEIKEEQTVRRLDPFLRFLEVAAQCNGEILNHSKIARDVGSDPKGVERYFEILDDTLLGVHLEPFHASVRKRQTRRSKFYFFDLGVTRALTHQLDAELSPRTFAYGRAFEHFFILECMRLRDYRRRDEQFFYLRTKDDLEIDLIIERGGSKRTLIEIKSSNNVDATELTHQRKLARDLAPCDFWVASNERQARSIDGVEILPWREVLTRLYGSEI